MEKKFSKFEIARMKRTAQNVNQYLTKKNKLVAKITELQAELESITKLIELTDAPTKAITGGYGTEEILKKVVTPTDKLDKDGNVIKQTTYEFIYPDTIIPPTVVEEAASADETTTNEVIVPPTTEDTAGSDFDVDSENEEQQNPNYGI